MALSTAGLTNYCNETGYFPTSDSLITVPLYSSNDSVIQISKITQKIIEKKNENIKSSIASTKGKYLPKSMQEMAMIGGDLFNGGFLAFEAVKGFFPSIGKVPSVLGITASFGIIGGIFNLGGAINSGYASIEAFNNGDKAKGYRLAYDAFFLGMLGIFMIVVSVSSPASPLILFLDTYCWILPLLWFALSGPTFGEILFGLQKIWRKLDIVSKLNLDQLSKKINDPNFKWENITAHLKDTVFDVSNLNGKSDNEIAQSLSEKIEVIQAEWGPELAVSLMELLNLILNEEDKAEIINKIQVVQKQRDFWYMALKVRLFQHILFTVAFAVSMGTLQLDEEKARTIEAGVNAFMALGNLIPTYMDANWLFARNTMKVVAKVDHLSIATSSI